MTHNSNRPKTVHFYTVAEDMEDTV